MCVILLHPKMKCPEKLAALRASHGLVPDGRRLVREYSEQELIDHGKRIIESYAHADMFRRLFSPENAEL